jgi:formylglycine-generating enzyme required for sulfatase activity
MNRLVRGGAFLNDRDGSRCAFRDHFHPDSLGGFLGFRVVLSAPPVSGS